MFKSIRWTGGQVVGWVGCGGCAVGWVGWVVGLGWLRYDHEQRKGPKERSKGKERIYNKV